MKRSKVTTLLATVLGCSLFATTSLVYANPTNQFVGAFQTKTSYVLVNSPSASTLEMHGKDAVSYWDAKCKAVNDGKFICTGSGNSKGGKFNYSSELVIKNGSIEENWKVEAVVKGGESKNGTDKFIPLVIPEAISTK